MKRRAEHDLVRLADETLTDAERRRALERLEEDPERALAAQRRVKAALGGLAVDAPPRLRETVAQMQAEADARGPAIATPRLALGAVAAASLAAIVLVVAVFGGAGDVTASALASVSQKPVAAAAPRPAEDPALLARSFAGVTFPRWDAEFGWRALGARVDNVAGRRAETVFYLHEGHRLAYTVLAGAALEPPAGARRVATPSGPVYVYAPAELGDVALRPRARDHGGELRAAVFVRNGRTCVLAGVAHREQTLIELASWPGDEGTIRF